MRDIRGTVTAVVGTVMLLVPFLAQGGRISLPLLVDPNAIRVMMNIQMRGDLTWTGLAVVLLGFCLFLGGAFRAAIYNEWPNS